MFKSVLTFVLLKTVLCEIVKDNCTADEFSDEHIETRVLSRRKRFLIFPEGSSLQLVFCTQTSSIIPIGDIFLYANTAALAWMLPTDPKLLDDLRQRQKIQRRGDKLIGYVDDRGRVLAKVPYKKKTIVKPVFAKRSTGDNPRTFKEKLKLKIDLLHKYSPNYMRNVKLSEKSKEIHRSSRYELYGKIAALLTLMNKDGKQCVLYKLCQSAKSNAQGTFVGEFFKAIFTLPKSDHLKEELQEYDIAHTFDVNCTSKYPHCCRFHERTRA